MSDAGTGSLKHIDAMRLWMATHLDLPEQVGDVLVIKGQGAAQQRIQDDAAAPHIHLWPTVQLP